MKFLLSLVLSLGAFAQAPPTPIAGGGGVVGSYQQAYDLAWYASRPPQMQPLYYGRAGVVVPQGAQPLTQAQFEALISGLVQNPPKDDKGVQVPIVEQIDYWQWEPYS